MKQLFTTAVLLFSATAFAQVGINNTSPKATLDITAKTTDGSKAEGLIIPQVAGNQIRTATASGIYGTSQKGLIVYASSADSAPAGATVNITAPGYYYFDGSVWQRIAAGGSSLNTTLNSGNIYVGNASNVATAVAPTGDVTISNTGVTSIGAGKVTSSQIADGTVANADLATAAALTVKGNATNATATPTDIAAGTDGYVLRRSGTALGFGTIATAGIADGAVTAAKLNQMSANSGQVLGWNGTAWAPTAVDNTNDAWMNDTTNTQVKLGTKTDGSARTTGTDFVINDDGKVGIGTSTPTTNLDVIGSEMRLRGGDNPVLRIHSAANDVNKGGSIEFNENSTSWGMRIRHSTGSDSSSNEGLIFESKISDVYSPILTLDETSKFVGIGTSIPAARLEVNSGTSNKSGLKFTNLNSSSTVGTGQALGVDSSGNVITVPNPTASSVTTSESYLGGSGNFVSPYNVNDSGWTTVPSTSQTITIPAGGKGLFINFMLGIDYASVPTGSGSAYYTARLFVDGVATNVFQTTQESGQGTQTQYNLNSVIFLSAGSHTVDVRMMRTYNNGTTSGQNMSCGVMSMSFNASYIN